MNIAYATVDFFYHLALVVWLGGILILVSLVAPTIFKTAASREEAGTIFGNIIRRFQTVQFVCMLAVLGTSMIKLKFWENATPPITIRYLLIFAMVILTVFHSSIVTRRLRALKGQAAFPRWHRISVIATCGILLLGLGALYFS